MEWRLQGNDAEESEGPLPGEVTMQRNGTTGVLQRRSERRQGQPRKHKSPRMTRKNMTSNDPAALFSPNKIPRTRNTRRVARLRRWRPFSPGALALDPFALRCAVWRSLELVAPGEVVVVLVVGVGGRRRGRAGDDGRAPGGGDRGGGRHDLRDGGGRARGDGGRGDDRRRGGRGEVGGDTEHLYIVKHA